MFVIISAEKAERSTSVNAKNTDQLRQFIKKRGLDYQEGKSVWEGTQEQVFVIDIDTEKTYDDLETIAELFKQDYMLYVHNDGGFLHRPGTLEVEGLGTVCSWFCEPDLGNYIQLGEDFFLTFE